MNHPLGQKLSSVGSPTILWVGAGMEYESSGRSEQQHEDTNPSSSKVPKKKHKSGAQKKKDKETRSRLESAKFMRPLDNFFNKDTSISAGANKDDPQYEQDPGPLNLSAEAASASESRVSTAQSSIEDGSGEKSPKDFMFVKPSASQIDEFFEYHPQVPLGSVPFSVEKAFTRKTPAGTVLKRCWLTFQNSTQALYCSLCLAYSNNPTVFKSGLKNFTHVHQRIEEHESSNSHSASVEAFMMHRSDRGMVQLFSSSSIDARRKKVERNRDVVQKLIRIILFLGKQGLAYRGKRHEAAHEIKNENVNHGNYIELVKLVSEFDIALKEHIDKVHVASSKALNKRICAGQQSGNYGRGSLVTFLSHDITSRIVRIIRDLVQESIVREVKEAGMFSVELDTTQDIMTQDQCSIVLRYVYEGVVHERLLSLVKATLTTGEALFNLLNSTLQKYDLDIKNCVGDAFDGAANMSGAYNGVTAKISSVASLHVHTWCYSHCLNLLLTDAASACTQAMTLFGVLQSASRFFRQAHKRMDVWENMLAEKGGTARRLGSIGETRWLSKSIALEKIFGTFRSPNTGLYTEMIRAFQDISEDKSFQQSTRSEARMLMDSFLKFETILTSFVFLRIYKITTPLSLYLQTKGLDMLQAWRMVEAVAYQINEISRDFEEVHEKAKAFCADVNEALEDTDLEVASYLPKKRARKTPRRAVEQCHDERVCGELEGYKVNTFNVVMDSMVENLKIRFLKHKQLYQDFACFDPRRFPELRKQGVPEDALEKISEILGDRVKKEALRSQLESFMEAFPRLVRSLSEEFETTTISEEDENANESTTEMQTNRRCRSCFTCVYQVLYNHSLNSAAYSEVYIVYHFLLTLAVTQVECERSFSKLKLIKTRLRATLTQENLECFMLMGIESDILNRIPLGKVVDSLASTSSELKRLLSLHL